MPEYDKIKRNYSKDDIEMLAQAQLFQTNFTTDQADFTAAFPKFITPYEIDFQTAIDNADAIPFDDEIVQQIAVITEQIEPKMDMAREAIQKLFVYVNVAFSHSEASLKMFGKSEYENARKNAEKMKELLEKANRMASIADHKTALLNAGYSQASIDELLTIMGEIETLNANKDELYSLRLKQTEDRIIAYNAVWDLLKEVSEASKVVYWDSPAKLAQYVLNPSTHPLPSKVVGMAWDDPTKTVSWDAAAGADTYELAFAMDTPEPIFIVEYEGTDRSHSYDPGGPDNYLFKCRAVNSNGPGPFSDVLIVERS
jgi:hypothetical protein